MHLKLSAALLAATALAACSTVPSTEVARPAFTAAPPPASTGSELPRNARPLHYAIAFAPDLNALTFAGSSATDIEVYEQSTGVTLNALDLEISSATLVAADGTSAPLAIAQDGKKQTVTLSSAGGIAPGTYRLDLIYTGKINTQANGLFALDYPDKRSGKEVRALFTQFEAADGRRFAPMFDEPSYKASFDLTAIVPEALMAVGNTQVVRQESLGNGSKRVTFATTPKMSSYLLFFGLGDFERRTKMTTDGVEVGIVAPSGSGDQADYALAGLAELVPYYNDYFGINYPLAKLDNVAGPGSSQFFAAMENWGAIFTFESVLLDDPKLTSVEAKQGIYTTQAHEVAHQWFGNIVTMGWWDDLWLNEGFASWMETKATAHFNPEWHSEMTRIAGREAAMALDSLATTHPIVQKIDSVDALGSAFDTIAYQKGEAVIAMLEAYAGEDTWRNGLRGYMRDHAYGNTRNTDLWQAVEAAGAKNLTDVAHDFTLKPGVPLVEVTGAQCEGGQTHLGLVQKEFSRDRKEEALAQPTAWKVPLVLRIGAGEGTRFVLDGKADLVLDGCGPVVVNGGQLGYFRTLYTPAALANLTAGFGSLAPIDQYGLMRDNLALSLSGHQSMAAGLDVLAAVPADAQGVLAESVLNRWAEFHGLLKDEKAKAKLAARIEQAWLPRLNALGFDPKPGESILDSQLRGTLIRVLGGMGSKQVVAEAGRRFAMLETDPAALDGPLKTTWGAVIASKATRAQWQLMRKLAASSKSAVERQLYFAALGANEDEAIARDALALALTGEPGATNSAIIVGNVAFVHTELAWNFVKAHGEAIDKLVDSSGKAGFFAGLFGASETPEMLAEAKAYRDTLPEEGRASINRAIAAVENRLASEKGQRDGLTEWLAAH